MTTITIPRADYVQRADDEGRDFYALRTIRAAAPEWADDGRGTRDYLEHGPDEAVTFVFAEYNTDDDSMSMTDVHADADMEDLYPAEDLPFTIAPRRFDVGDYITHDPKISDTVWKVTNVGPVGYDLISTATGAAGSVSLFATGYVVVPAPTVTYTVTVRADHTTDDVADMLGNLDGPVEVSRS